MSTLLLKPLPIELLRKSQVIARVVYSNDRRFKLWISIKKKRSTLWKSWRLERKLSLQSSLCCHVVTTCWEKTLYENHEKKESWFIWKFRPWLGSKWPNGNNLGFKMSEKNNNCDRRYVFAGEEGEASCQEERVIHFVPAWWYKRHTRETRSR